MEHTEFEAWKWDCNKQQSRAANMVAILGPTPPYLFIISVIPFIYIYWKLSEVQKNYKIALKHIYIPKIEHKIFFLK